ncbi:MAG: secretin N-terminal domain-containing protein, partial [Pirellula sp.]
MNTAPQHWLRLLLCANFASWMIVLLVHAPRVSAQPPGGESPTPLAPGTVKLNLKGETPIGTLIEYVSQRLKIRFLYDESLAQKKIFLQVPDEVPVASLMDLLHSVLKINDLVMIETETKGWFRITSSANIPKVAISATPQDVIAEMGAATPVTQVFLLKRADPNQIMTLVQPFLTAPGANSIPVAANRTLIVTDVASNLRRIQRLIELLDAEQFTSTIRFVPVKHISIEDAAEQLTLILEARSRTESGGSPGSMPQPNATANTSNRTLASAPGIEIAIDRRMNQLIMVGLPSRIDAAVELLKSLDIP